MDFSRPGFGSAQPIDSYGGGGFRLGRNRYAGSILVLPSGVRAWSCMDVASLGEDGLEAVFAEAGDIDVLLLGCGAEMVRVAEPVRARLRDAGVVIEPMATGAACRTYNVLIAEHRKAAAALIAVD